MNEIYFALYTFTLIKTDIFGNIKGWKSPKRLGSPCTNGWASHTGLGSKLKIQDFISHITERYNIQWSADNVIKERVWRVRRETVENAVSISAEYLLKMSF